MIRDLTEDEIDELVISEADNNDAWEKPIRVNRRKVFSSNLPPPFEIAVEKEILSGEPVFRGTRVPVSALLDDLESGASLDEFLESFPAVKREQGRSGFRIFRRIVVTI